MATSESGRENLPKSQNSWGGGDDDEILIRKYCPICCKPFARAAVFRCDYGHLACSICCPKLENKCAFCCSSIGSIRYRSIEEVFGEGISQNQEKEIIIPQDQQDHDKYCPYVPRCCPFSDCNVAVPRCKLYQHVSVKHTPNNDSSTVGFVFNQPFQIALNPTIILQEENNHKVRFALKIAKYPWNNPWITLVRMPCELSGDEDMEDQDIEIEAFFPNPFPIPIEDVEAKFSYYLSAERYSSTDMAKIREILLGFHKLWFPMEVESVTPKDLEWWREGPHIESDPFIEKILSNLIHPSTQVEDIEKYIPKSSEEIPMAMEVVPRPDPDPSFAHANFVHVIHIPILDIPVSYRHYIGCTPLNICIKQKKKASSST